MRAHRHPRPPAGEPAGTRSITLVAFDVGYESPSAFTAMFHRAFGEPPSAYIAR